MGKDCSGYKTTLTWGVGVASRGKLRGLSLPVANSTQKANQDSTDSKTQDSNTENDKSTSKRRHSEGTMKSEDTSYYYSLSTSPDPSMSPMPSSFQSSAPIPIPHVPSQGWHIPNYHESFDGFGSPPAKAHRHSVSGAVPGRPAPLQCMGAFSPSSFDESLFSAPSTGSVGTFSESDFPSPNELPPTPEEIPCQEPYINQNMDMFLCGPDGNMSHQMPLDVCHSMTLESDPSLGFNMDPFEAPNSLFSLPPAGPSTSIDGLGVSNVSASYITPAQTPLVGPTVLAGDHSPSQSSNWSSPAPSSSTLSRFPNVSPRMASLIEYYDKAVCPVLVAVDGPTNPYRVHILALASSPAGNPSLVNAVAALAANVLHLRGKSTDATFHMSPNPSQRGVGDEAIFYKNSSVTMFNNSLRDPTAAHDDSILATLIVLSLLNISEGGIAKLKSQMPGIRQIMALRGSSTSQFLHWSTYFFTLLDLMTAVVNDRTSQQRSPTLDLLDFSANMGALEHLAHCEGRMFKVLSRMGPSPRFGSSPQWSSPETPRPINPFTGLPLSPTPPSDFSSLDAIVNDCTGSDARQEFWSEWQHVRGRLRSWSRSSSCPSTPSFNTPKKEQEAVLVSHASEVYRHASLLFAERLAFPSLPPSAPQIQHLVSATLHHLSSIPANSIFNTVLLWPLMVVGTECVAPSHRDVIRLRAGDAMRESGFFAHLSGLDVLERVWAADDAGWDAQAGMGWEAKGSMPALTSLGGQAGRWRRAMGTVQVDFRMG